MGNVPPQPTHFIGRVGELEVLQTLLEGESVRLLTLTGPPGVGKTRLAIEVAHRMQRTFEHGIHFVNLGPLQDPDLVPLAIVQSLGLQGRRHVRSGLTALASNQLAQYLRNKHTLLILDNFEHIRPAGALISNLLTACPYLKFLVTSREALRIGWEREYLLSAFPIPSIHNNAFDAELQKAEPAIALFVDRARAVLPDYTLTSANVGAVVEICRRLDGLPLAIELAAGRIRTLSPQGLASHLAHRFDVLVSRRLDSQARHRSLYDSIAWSYQLLSQREQSLFRRLAVFRGGFSLEGADTVLRPHTETELINALSSIVEKNLLTATHGKIGKTRYAFLESLREFAAHEMEAAGETNSAEAAHATYFLDLAEEANLACNGPDQAIWLDKIEEELDNFRAALHWNIDHEPAAALRIAIGLQWFWEARGYFIESHRWYETCLGKAEDTPPGLRAQALAADGMILVYLNTEESIRASMHGLELARTAGEHVAEAFCLRNLGLAALDRGDFGRAETCYAERLSLHERYGPPWAIANTLSHMAALARVQGDLDRAAFLAAKNLEISRPLHSKRMIALGLRTLGRVALQRGELRRASELFEESAAIDRELGAVPRVARSLAGLGLVAFRQGDLQRARKLAAESVRMNEGVGHWSGVAETIIDLCVALVAEDDPHRAARWLGFAHAVKEEIGTVAYFPVDKADVDRLTMALRASVGDTAFDELWNGGRHLSTEQVLREVASAFAEPVTPSSEKSAVLLSPRERQVAALVAEGLSNQDIAAQLHIGVRTAETHVQSIMNKLGFHNRTQVAAWVAKQHSP